MLDPFRLIVLAAIAAGIGFALLASHFRWFRPVSITNRLLPFAGGSQLEQSRRQDNDLFSNLLPTLSRHADRFANTLGVRGDLATRLRQAGRGMEPSAFRNQQLGWCAGSIGAALLALVATSPSIVVYPLFLLGAPLLAFLALEQRLSSATAERRKQLFDELPIVSEQLAMLLSAGYSVGSALNRLADRNSGVSGDDLRRVTERIRTGLGIGAALTEWSDQVDVVELKRLVAILTLSRESGDIGRLVADEATSIRRESHRRLIESIEKRGQQVWVPVTVATLVPGVIFLIIPFLQALSLFSTT